MSFNNFVVISKNIVNVCSRYVDNGLYCIEPIFNDLLNMDMFKIVEPTPKWQKVSDDEIHLWYLIGPY